MKKKCFFSGISAKLALAAVALTTVMFTSCDEEEFNVEPIETAPASAQIVATVYDQTTGVILGTQSTSITAGADGTIAATTVTVNCPSFNSEGYLPVASTTVSVPSLSKGQFALIPVSFYALKVASAAQNISVTENPGSEVEKKQATGVLTYGPYDVNTTVTVEYEAWVGQEITNISAVNSKIDALVGRSLSSSDIAAVLKSVVASYNTGLKKETKTQKVEIPLQTTVTFSPVSTIIESTISIKATVDGTEYTINDVQLRKAGETVVTAAYESHAGHDHGHGDSGQAGGGAGGK